MSFARWGRGAARLGLAAGLAVVSLCAQTAGNADALSGVDFSGLTAAQKQTAIKILQEQDCTCGCSMKIAECRVKDPSCAYSTGLASTIIETLKKGDSEQQAISAAASSRYAHPPPERSNRLLDDPVPIATAGAPVLGPAKASLTLIEFSDFQCPYCVAATPELEALLKAYPSQVKLIFKQYPLDNHSQAAFAAAAALAAQRQNKFWQMHDALFAEHGRLSREVVYTAAKNIGIDMKRFEADLHSAAVIEQIKHDIADGDNANVQGTPTLFINGQRFNGPLTVQSLKPVVEAELKQPTQVKTAAAGQR